MRLAIQESSLYFHIQMRETGVGEMESIEMETLSSRMKQGRKASSFVVECKL